MPDVGAKPRAIVCRVLLRVSTIVDDTEAEGPGRRFALWVARLLAALRRLLQPRDVRRARGGEAVAIDALAERARAAAARGVEGITLLGGEPFEQAGGARRARARRAARAA